MGVIKRNGNTYGGGGGASADGKAESSAIAPVFDDTETYAEGDRVMYEDELYVFNTAHTGAWDAADADKSDVDSEMPEKLTAAQMAAIKAAFVIDAPRNGYPVLFDETGAEHFVGWYKLANGTKKPVYEKSYKKESIALTGNGDTEVSLDSSLTKTYAILLSATVSSCSYGEYTIGPIGINRGSTGTGSFGVSLVNSTSGLFVYISRNGSAYTLSEIYITVRFIKFADTPV